MKLTHRKSLLAGLVLLGVLSGLMLGAGLLFSDRVLDGVVRPRLVRMAAARLQAEVGVERLVWEDGGLTLTDLTVERLDRYRISLARMRVVPLLRDLFRRRLSVVELTDPHVEITPFQLPGRVLRRLPNHLFPSAACCCGAGNSPMSIPPIP